MLYDKPGSTRQLLPTLSHPVVKAIKAIKAIKDGILLQGIEIREGLKVIRQAWWCVPGLHDDSTLPG